MKKILALVLSLVMVAALFAGCGNKPADGSKPAGFDYEAIPNEMTSADGKYTIAFVTDVGQLLDKSFNQGTWEGVKRYASENSKSYKYYQPANGDQATDADRYDAMKAAVDNGAEIVICAGFLQSVALEQAAKEFTGVKFVFIDGWSLGLDNVLAIDFQEEQSGYLAGYAAVMEGYTKLGFTGGGGGTNPACQRFGYGFAQGAEAAAAEQGVKVELNYSWMYGASFSASPELQTMATGWYQNGTEVIFACGGSMFSSVVAAAGAEDGMVVGVDVDQSYEGEGTVITSAMKGLADATVWAIAKHYAGEFADIGGTSTSLGAKDNAVGLPVATWSLENWSVEDYEALYQDIVDGKVEISAELVEYPESTDNVTVTPVK